MGLEPRVFVCMEDPNEKKQQTNFDVNLFET